MEYCFKFLGLELPLEKYELEQYITDRRAMTVKNLLRRKKKKKEIKKK